MTRLERGAIRRWIREFVVIVLGVLVALWVSDWSQGRQDRQRERIDLQQLLATTRENEQRVVAAINEDSSALAAAFGEPAGAMTWRAPALERALFMQTIISNNRVSDLRQLLDATRALRGGLEATLRTGG